MTVSELITILLDVDPDKEVFVVNIDPDEEEGTHDIVNTLDIPNKELDAFCIMFSTEECICDQCQECRDREQDLAKLN